MAYTLKEIRTMLDDHKISSEELVRHYFEVIEKDNERKDKINGFITLLKEQALFSAKEADKELFDNTAPMSKPLLGIPIAVKDLINVKDTLTTCASNILHNHQSIYNAHVVDELVNAGAVIIGKTNMDEFAMGSSNETSYYGAVKNPRNREYSPGGSSGGSGAVVGAEQVPMALGTDTGGSIRLPASFCGVTGMKPTYGRVSRYGLVAFASSFDQIGPMTHDIEDNAITLSVIAGYDPKDSTSVKIEVQNYAKNIDEPVKGLKIGLPKEFISSNNQPEVNKAVEDAVEVLKKQGCEIIDISLPHTEYGISAYYLISTAEASSNLARFDGVRYGYRTEKESVMEMYKETREQGFGEEVKRRILLGTYALSAGYYDAYYKKAQKVRTLIKQDFVKAFEKVDAVISPASPTTAFKLGEKINDPLSMYMNDVYTVTANLAGVPALVVPFRKDAKKLPIGIQLIGNYFKENQLYKIGKKLEDSAE